MTGVRERLDVPEVPPLPAAVTRLLTSPREKPIILPPQKSALLAQLETFLPAMHSANRRLEAELDGGEPVDRFDIEHKGGDDEPHIEMDLACGVVELQDEAAVQAAERALAAGAAVEGEAPPGASRESSSDSEGEWSSDPEKEDGEGNGQEDSIGAALKPCGKRKRAGIVVLDGS